MASKKNNHHTYVISIAAAITLIVGIIFVNGPTINPSHLRQSENTQAAEINNIINGSFENNLDNWSTVQNSGNISIDSSNKIDGNSSVILNITSAKSKNDTQLFQKVPVTPGKIYIVKFSAKASINRKIDFKIDSGGSDINHFEQEINITTTWQEYSYQFKAKDNDLNPRYQFSVGNVVGQVWIDKVMLTHSDSSSQTSNPTPIQVTTKPSTPKPQPTNSPTTTPNNDSNDNSSNSENDYDEYEDEFDEYIEDEQYPNDESSEYFGNTEETTSQNNQSLIISNNTVNVILDRSTTTGEKIYGPGFNLTSSGATLWNIKYTSNVSGLGFEPSSAVIKPNQTSTIRTYASTSKPNGKYTGSANIEYFYNGTWHPGPIINYTITIIGSLQSISTDSQSSSIFNFSNTNNNPLLNITQPTHNQSILSGKSIPIQWEMNTTTPQIETAILLHKDSGNIINTIATGIKSNTGNNTLDWKIPNMLPGDYKITVTTDKDLASTSDSFTIGSRLIIKASGTPHNNIYPTMQLSINNKLIKTYYGVRGNNNENFAQYYYYSPTKINPKSVKISYVNDEYSSQNNDRNLIIDKINIDGIDYQTEDTLLQSEWLLTNSSVNY